MSWRAAPEAKSRSHPEQLGQISAHTSLMTVTAKNLHPLTVSGVTGVSGPDKMLLGLSHLTPPPLNNPSSHDLLSPTLFSSLSPLSLPSIACL